MFGTQAVAGCGQQCTSAFVLILLIGSQVICTILDNCANRRL